jgi:hypothetical protein
MIARGMKELGAALATFAATLAAWRGFERLVFPSAYSLRVPSLIEAGAIAATSAAALLLVTRRSGTSRLAVKLLAIAAALSVLQWVWLVRLQPWWTSSDTHLRFESRHPILLLFVEAAVPAIAGTALWMFLSRRKDRFCAIALAAASLAASVAALLLISPEVVRGALEQAGWVELAVRDHLSGAHSAPVRRHVGYIVAGALTGFLFHLWSDWNSTRGAKPQST